MMAPAQGISQVVNKEYTPVSQQLADRLDLQALNWTNTVFRPVAWDEAALAAMFPDYGIAELSQSHDDGVTETRFSLMKAKEFSAEVRIYFGPKAIDPRPFIEQSFLLFSGPPDWANRLPDASADFVGYYKSPERWVLISYGNIFMVVDGKQNAIGISRQMLASALASQPR